MSNFSCKMEELKMKLQSARKIKLKNERLEHTLHLEEIALTTEITLINTETDSIAQNLEDVKKQLSLMKYQNTMIDVCSESEKIKIECHINNTNEHRNGFDILFTKELDVMEFQHKELKAKIAEKDELERQKNAKVLERNEQIAKETAAIEEEHEDLLRECNILRKRNNAIMLMLRRKLIEAEETRRSLIKD